MSSHCHPSFLAVLNLEEYFYNYNYFTVFLNLVHQLILVHNYVIYFQNLLLIILNSTLLTLLINHIFIIILLLLQQWKYLVQSLLPIRRCAHILQVISHHLLMSPRIWNRISRISLTRFRLSTRLHELIDLLTVFLIHNSHWLLYEVFWGDIIEVLQFLVNLDIIGVRVFDSGNSGESVWKSQFVFEGVLDVLFKTFLAGVFVEGSEGFGCSLGESAGAFDLHPELDTSAIFWVLGSYF